MFRLIALLVCVAFLCAALPVWQNPIGQPPAQPPPPAVEPAHLLWGTAELGLTPEVITAAGCANQTTAMMTAFGSAAEALASIRQIRESQSEAAESLATLRSLRSANPANETVVAQYQAAASQSASLQAQLLTARQSLWNHITQSLGSEQRARLAIVAANVGHRVPAQFKVKQRSEDDWSALELAVVAESRATRLNRELASDFAALLTQVRSEPEVVQAATDLQTSLAAVEQTFSASASPVGQPE